MHFANSPNAAPLVASYDSNRTESRSRRRLHSAAVLKSLNPESKSPDYESVLLRTLWRNIATKNSQNRQLAELYLGEAVAAELAELAELALVNQVDDVTTDQLMTTPYRN